MAANANVISTLVVLVTQIQRYVRYFAALYHHWLLVARGCGTLCRLMIERVVQTSDYEVTKTTEVEGPDLKKRGQNRVGNERQDAPQNQQGDTI